MKALFSLFAGLLVSASAFAITPVDANGDVFGVVSGHYEGSGTLTSQSAFVPNTKFSSVRDVGQGMITAQTSATLMGIEVAKASAQLKVQLTSATNFNLLDANNSDAVCGQGSCDATSCTFTATVMSGQLTLTETWVPTTAGFDVVNASQNFKGKAATYSGSFSESN